MSEILLQTKLYFPPPRPDLVPRPRLIEDLNASLAGKLTLISAPAGYGKTTLLCHWISQLTTPVAWLTLEENDNDLVRFLAYFVAALRTAGVHIDIAIDEQLLVMGRDRQQADSKTLLVVLINQVLAAEGRLVLVLDDYHLIKSQDVHETLTFWLDHQPPAMRTVIASRSDPPLPLARMRARGEMTELRQSDLRFSLDEGHRLLNQVQDLNLSPEDIQALMNRTEGWIAGLQMASIALKGRGDASSCIQDFTGSHEYIADYLHDEVLGRQPDQVREFLLKTSILDRLTGPLCDVVTGQANGRQTLKQLRTSNVFLTSLDDAGQWYQYHRLFADLLQQRLLEKQADIVPSLCLKASQWWERNGFPAEAIEYALRGEHFERASALIEQAAEPTVKRSEIATFRRWVERLPNDLIRSNVTLSIFYAWALLVSDGQPQEASSYIDGVVPENEQIGGRLKTIKSMLAMYQRQIPEAVALARQALEELPEEDLFFYNLAAWNLSALLYMRGDRGEGERMLEQVVDVSRRSGNRLVAVITLCRLAQARMQRGALFHPKALYQEALDLATDAQGTLLPIACEALIGLGTIHYLWDDLDPAVEYLLRGTELSKRWREQPAIGGYVTLAHLKQSQREDQPAIQMMEQARLLAARTTATKADDQFVASQQAHLWVRQGDLQAAKRWADGQGLTEYLQEKVLPTTGHIAADLLCYYELLVFARLLVAQQRSAEASRLLALLLPALEQIGSLEKVLEAHMLQAVAQLERGLFGEAVSSLATAVTLASPEGYRRPFLDEGPTLIPLLKEVAAQAVEVEFVHKVLKALSDSRPTPIVPKLAEPLSERELEVLRLLDTNLTVPDIAEELVIAVSTTRSHVKSIYAKLEVHSRYEAVSKARDIDLL